MKNLKHIVISGICICIDAVLAGFYIYVCRYVMDNSLSANDLALLQMENTPDSTLRLQQYTEAVNFTTQFPIVLFIACLLMQMP